MTADLYQYQIKLLSDRPMEVDDFHLWCKSTFGESQTVNNNSCWSWWVMISPRYYVYAFKNREDFVWASLVCPAKLQLTE